MLAWVVRYVMFGYGNAGPLAWMPLYRNHPHGICYDFFFVMGQVYIDQKHPLASALPAQGLMTFLTYGIGMFVGSLICRRIVDFYAKPSPAGAILHDWRAIWMVPAIASAVVLVFFWIGFRNEDRAAAQPLAKTESVSSALSR